MKKQTKQVIILVALSIAWGISSTVNNYDFRSAVVIKPKIVKAVPQDSMLKVRFHKIRAEMDSLYHYRLKPIPFDSSANPFRIPDFLAEELAAREARAHPMKRPTVEAQPEVIVAAPDETGQSLLKHAVELTRFGGVVTMNGTTQINVNGELHKEGELFTARVRTKLVLVRIKQLTTAFVDLVLDDAVAGGAEVRVRLN
jgi:hypothetical protein